MIYCNRNYFLENNYGTDIYVEYCGFLKDKYNINIAKEEIFEIRKKISHEYVKSVSFRSYISFVLKKLKEMGFILVLATASTQNEILVYSRENKNMLREANISDVFDLIVTKENVKEKKPSPEVYLYVLDYFHARSDECLVFEDSLLGIMASKGAGIETINIYEEYSDCDREKINELADYMIRDYSEFLDIIEKCENRKLLSYKN